MTSGYVFERSGPSPKRSAPLSGTTLTPGPTRPGGSRPTLVDVRGRLAVSRSARAQVAQPLAAALSAAAIAASPPPGPRAVFALSRATSAEVVIEFSL